MEKEVKITAKLYKCRDTAKGLFKEEIKSKLEPYTDIIKKVMEANKEEVLDAVLRISTTKMYQGEPMTQMMFMAAAVELIEPSL